MKKHIRMIVIALVILLMLACGTPSVVSTTGPNLEGTQAALAQTQTALNNVPLVPSATVGVQNQDPNLVKTQVAMAGTQTAMNIVLEEPTATATQEPTATATQEQQPSPTVKQDIQTLIDSSNILVYEDMVGDTRFITYVAKALKSVGGHHEYVGDAMGTFMDKLDSATKWDLIIVAAESRQAIRGDYWTIIKDKVDDGAALVAEMWYLDKINDGMISPLLNECGVEVQADWQRTAYDNPIEFEMFWVEPSSPVFNTPNQVSRFKSSLTDPAWPNGDIGDFLKLRSGSNAHILASHAQGQDSSYGLITSCMDGRVIWQTFNSHNYPTNDMIALWQNYINYTLTNHFLATP
jgi:hypothetical protein